MQAVTFGLLAVIACAAAVLCGQHAVLGGPHAISRGAFASFGGAQHDRSAGDRAPAVGMLGGTVALSHHEIARVGGLVAGLGAYVSLEGARVASACDREAHGGALFGLLAVARAVLAAVAPGLVRDAIAAVREILVAGGLVAVEACLVKTSTGLVGFSERSPNVGERLVALEDRRRGAGARTLSLDRAVGGLHRVII
ncbi:MAG: hypothetical protein M3Y09_14730 [Actinomycetota bacterium]|nr:hypothetical protein [Actinomycetota bacterium]